MQNKSAVGREIIVTIMICNLKQIGRLQNQIEDLMENQRDNEQRQLRMKDENFLLSEKLAVDYSILFYNAS